MTAQARHVVEHIAQSSVPIPVGVSGMTLFGVTFQDWVLIGTAMLLVFQIIVIFPKVALSLRKVIRALRRKNHIKEAYPDYDSDEGTA